MLGYRTEYLNRWMMEPPPNLRCWNSLGPLCGTLDLADRFKVRLYHVAPFDELASRSSNSTGEPAAASIHSNIVSPMPRVVIGDGGLIFGHLLVHFSWCSAMQLLRPFWWFGMSSLFVCVPGPFTASQAKCPAMIALKRAIFHESVAQLSVPRQLYFIQGSGCHGPPGVCCKPNGSIMVAGLFAT